MFRRPIMAVGVLAAAVALGACGSDDDSDETADDAGSGGVAGEGGSGGSGGGEATGGSADGGRAGGTAASGGSSGEAGSSGSGGSSGTGATGGDAGRSGSTGAGGSSATGGVGGLGGSGASGGSAGATERCDGGTGNLDLLANVETIGVVVAGTGLPETAELSYREAGAGSDDWRAGHPMLRIDDGRLASSLFGLQADTDYEVRVVGGGVEACAAVRTQPEALSFSAGQTLHVDASAPAGGDGSEGSPFNSIQAAVDAAGPGTRVLVADGVYHEAVDVSVSGSAGDWVQIIAEGNGAILDGAEHLSSLLYWEAHPSVSNVWSAEAGGSAWYLARDGERCYRFNDLDGLLAGLGDDDVPMDEGFYIEPDTTTLWVRSLDDPLNYIWQIPRFSRAFEVDAQDWIWIEGFEIRFYGQAEWSQGVYLKNASHVVVRNNTIHGVPDGITVNWTAEDTDRSNDTRIEDNEIYDPPVNEWPWDAVKGTSMEGSAISVASHRGAIVRRNDIHNFFNGIYTGRWGDLENVEIAFDIDVYENQIRLIGDDGFEPEGACINNRFRNNTFDQGLVGISLAPITFGPAWVLRSVFSNFTGTSLKWGIDSDGVVLIYHNTSWVDEDGEGRNAMTIGSEVHNSTMRNNVFRGTRYAFEVSFEGNTGHDWDSDNWHTTRGSDEPHFKWENVRYDTMTELCSSTGLECNGHEDDPGLADPAGGDFTLDPDSPNVDRGVRIPGINDDSVGEPDIGCYELGG